jgi:hypothetical protein
VKRPAVWLAERACAVGYDDAPFTERSWSSTEPRLEPNMQPATSKKPAPRPSYEPEETVRIDRAALKRAAEEGERAQKDIQRRVAAMRAPDTSATARIRIR